MGSSARGEPDGAIELHQWLNGIFMAVAKQRIAGADVSGSQHRDGLLDGWPGPVLVE